MPSLCFLSFFKFSYLAKVNIAQTQNTHTHTLSPDTKTMVDTLLLLVPLKRPTSITSWPILTSEVAESIKNIYLGA